MKKIKYKQYGEEREWNKRGGDVGRNREKWKEGKL